MLQIGLTGGIGTGKTTVANIFKVLGVPVFDADYAAKKIMNENEELKQALRIEFGNEIYKDNLLDRKYLANIVFNNSYKLEKLNALVHPIAIKASNDWALQQKAPYVIKEAALMFEAGTAMNLDYVIGVFAPLPLRLERIMKRDAISQKDIEARMQHQIDENIKIKLCDFIIFNDEKHILTTQTIVIEKKILQLVQ